MSTKSPFDLLDAFHKDQTRIKKASNQLNLKREISSLLAVLRKSCLPTGQRIFWPSDGELDRLDQAVVKLSRAIKPHKPTSHWTNYKNVDYHYPGLNLHKTIVAFVRRAQKLPIRPLERFKRLSGELDSDFLVNREAIELFEEVIKTGKAPQIVKWSKFSGVFTKYRISKRKRLNTPSSQLTPLGCIESGHPDLKAYTVFLEIYCEDSAWRRMHYRGRFILASWITSINYPDILDDWKDIFYDEAACLSIETHSKQRSSMAQREKTRIRQARFRARKKAAKSVTESKFP